MADSIDAQFAAETALLDLKLPPGQERRLATAYAALREMVALVGAVHPMEAEPAHVFLPLAGGEGKIVVYPQEIHAATVPAVRAVVGGLKGGARPPVASPAELATAIRSADYLARDARWPDPR